METTDKKSVQQLTHFLWRNGLTRVVISPGSRNAPLILGFTAHPKYTCYSVPDERSAGFIALGMAHQSQNPVALVCSSGSALLNYYPAIAEAFYRKIPLLILSADRPERLVDQGDGQTIRQKNVYAQHILFSGQLESDSTNTKSIANNILLIQKAMNALRPSPIHKGGPVHFNLPFEEPLYLKVKYETPLSRATLPPIDQTHPTIYPSIDPSILSYVASIWNRSKRILILVGQKNIDTECDQVLQKISHTSLILCETTSNLRLNHANVISCIDRLITPLNASEISDLKCDLLITLNGNIVSKRIKAFIRTNQPKIHIHIEVSDISPNTYECLTTHINHDPGSFFTQLIPYINLPHSPYVNKWIEVDRKHRAHQINFTHTVAFSDFQVMHTLTTHLPKNSILHLANSTPVRYAQLFNWPDNIVFHSNRGTSGIDGIVSTAMGTAMACKIPVYLVVGDISFFYDTNAWWHRHIPNNLRVIVVNNDGGGIFRFIDGPKSTGQLEDYFETHQKNSVQHIALGFQVPYFCAHNVSELKMHLTDISTYKSAVIIEVKTPRTINAEVLKAYFAHFKDAS